MRRDLPPTTQFHPTWMPFLMDFDLPSTLKHAVPASAVVVLVNHLYEKMLIFFPLPPHSGLNCLLTRNWVILGEKHLWTFIPVSQKLPSACHSCFICEQGSLSDRCCLVWAMCLLSVPWYLSPLPGPVPRETQVILPLLVRTTCVVDVL